MQSHTDTTQLARPVTYQQRLVLAAVRKRRRLVREAVAAVEAASNAQTVMVDWQQSLSAALAELHRAFEAHVVDGLDPTGSLGALAFREPDLAVDVEQIRLAQVELLGQIAALATRMATGTRLQLRESVAELLVDLTAFRNSTADLFFSCYRVDLTRGAENF